MRNPSLNLSLLFVLGFSAIAVAEQVVVSEIMYYPPGTLPEFIELSNITATPLDIASWKFTDGVDFTFPAFNSASPSAHLLLPFEKILVSSASPAVTRTAYPGIPAGVRIFGPWNPASSLSNSGEAVTLKDKNSVLVCTVNYSDGGKWAVAPDGAGHSLVLADEDKTIDDWRVWRSSVNRLGSPGIADPAAPAAGLAIHEVYFSPLTGRVEWVELRNNSATSTLSAANLSLSPATDLSGPVALSGSITPGAVASFNVDFPTDNGGNVRIHLADSAGNVLDAVKLTSAPGRPSQQVFPPGGRQWFTATVHTRDAQNNPARNTDIVINEIMADPPSGQRDGEFIELFNKGAVAVNVGGWRLDDDVDFTIPPNTVIAPGGFLVLAANSAFLNASYAGLSSVGNWSGSLSNGGNRVQLKDGFGNLVDEVDYRFGGEWPELAAGDGSSLELVNPESDNAIGSSWRDSDESAKSTFTPFTINGGNYKRIAHGSVTDDEIQMWLVGDGHVVIRNAQLRPTSGGSDLFVNAGVTTLNANNTDGWRSRGTHWATYHDAEGVHILADGGGDNKVNHLEKDATGMIANTDYTLTFEARWVYGKPRIVAQSWDMSWGGTVLAPIPQNLGTPGAQNSRFVAAAPPELTALNHSPATPPTGSTVTVTARISSASPLASVGLFHRLDNATYTGAFTATTMTDNGTGGDAMAGDGVFSGQVPLASFGYNTAGTVVEFYVRATAANGQTTDLPRGANTGEPYATAQLKRGHWVVDNQTTSTELRRLRVVIPNYWLAALDTPDVAATPAGSGIPATGGGSAAYQFKFPKHNSHYFPCTVVMNDTKVIYGASVHKTGSPFTRATNNSIDRGRVALPGDQAYRGHGKIYWDNDGVGSNMHHNRVNRYLLYLCGVPANENEILKVTRNNAAYTVRESNEVFDKDMLNRIWENGSSGYFFENDDAHVIGDDGNVRLNSVETAWDYNPPNRPGAENPVSYHNNFVPGSRETEYDFAPVFEWNKQIEANTASQEQLERMADTRAMAAYAAVRGYTSDWDSLTLSRAKNGYFYNRPEDRKWMLIHWDSDLAFQTGQINTPYIGAEFNVPNYFNRSFVRREVYFYMAKLLGEYALNGPRLSAWLAAEEAASPSFAIPSTYATWPTTNATTGTVQTRVAVMQTFMGSSLTAPFALTSPPTTTSATVLTISGTAPANVFRVECVGHPESTFAWSGSSATDTAPWACSGLRLQNGANVLTFRAFDDNGAQLGADLTHSITKTNNATPYMSVSVSPGSQNAALGETVVIDASASFDPDGTPLSYTWIITPSSGFTLVSSTPSSRTIQFTVPGSYSFSVRGSDGVSNITVTRDITAYSTSDFISFGNDFLSPEFTTNNVELLDNYSPGSWYSLNETSGSLALNISDSATVPLTNASPTFPRITRALPATSNWVLQTSITPENRAFGNFLSGLYVETVESGTTVRYAFGYDGGLNWRVFKASGSGAYSQLGSVGINPPDKSLRVRRSANNLFFEYRLGGVQWASVGTSTMPAGSTVSSGGIFSATGTVGALPSSPGVGIRTAFDYLLFSDPGNTADLFNNLRITEIMYNPAGAGGVEFIELRNIGAAAINLNGAYFDQGDPISNAAGNGPFIFGATILQPGGYCVITNDTTAFTALYGNGAVVAGQYSGSLNNDGEHIVLRDSDGNAVHDFNYSDIAPWPVSADGTGPSIEALSNTLALYSSGTNWRASQEVGGSPGYVGFATDTDGDGTPDAVEVAFGSNPTSASSTPQPPLATRDVGTGATTISWASLAGKTYLVEYRNSLAEGAWETLSTVSATGASSSYFDATASSATQRFYRIKAQFP
jgi:hypothetical protein